MAYTASQRNPFMLMISPEIVLAAIEKSERLGQLNRQMCRPLDRIPPGAPEAALEGDGTDELEVAEAAETGTAIGQ
jgi:hypothetical protein